ncbi:chain-length determining protein [Bacteroidia bacterium]|nr:chain-length determining protein [Bacteroidia bacterium]
MEEQEIDLMKIFKRIWAQRKFILKVCGISLLIGIVIAFGIPKEYTTTTILAPESGGGGGGGGMGALAAMAGINLSSGGEKQEISPALYPDIARSTPFLAGLLNVPVVDARQKINTTLYNYLKEEQKSPWWSAILGLPGKVIGLFSSGEAASVSQEANFLARPIKLSGKDAGILSNLSRRIGVVVDKKTGVITLSSTMQSPEISAMIADTVVSYMQAYIISYRTQKARQDLAYMQMLHDEAQEQYYQAQKNYAGYQDGNLGVVSARYGMARERLQNEMNLAYSVYNQMAQQLQMAKVKVQNNTPVYTVIQPPIVPLRAASPRKSMILIGFLFLAFIGACGWILGKDYLMKQK